MLTMRDLFSLYLIASVNCERLVQIVLGSEPYAIALPDPIQLGHCCSHCCDSDTNGCCTASICGQWRTQVLEALTRTLLLSVLISILYALALQDTLFVRCWSSIVACWQVNIICEAKGNPLMEMEVWWLWGDKNSNTLFSVSVIAFVCVKTLPKENPGSWKQMPEVAAQYLVQRT